MTALEVAILFAHVTGRVLVLPPHAVLYLLHMNKKWGDNKSSMEDFLDFDRMRAGNGMETMTMEQFLAEVATPGLLKQPLPNNNSALIKQPLWTYLESASYVRQWSPGKTFIAFNISSADTSSFPVEHSQGETALFGGFEGVSKDRLLHISLDLKRQLVPYDEDFHSQRAVFFPGHDSNRLLTLWYGYFFFAEPATERAAKRYMRDRVRYHDSIFCVAGKVIDLLLKEVVRLRLTNLGDQNKRSEVEIKALPLVSYNGRGSKRVYRFMPINSSYIAYHIRRGDFQQKHTRLESQDIIDQSTRLIPGDPGTWVVYIATDETNRTFFEPFFKTFKSVRFLSDFNELAGIEMLNQNHLGMVEQVVCANAHTFIGTPLSTFTSFITRMRGYMDRTTLVEVENQHPKVLFSRLMKTARDAINSSIAMAAVVGSDQTKNKRKRSSMKKGLPIDAVRPNQIGRPVMQVSDDLVDSIGKVYKESRDVEEFGAYGEDDADADIFFSELHNDAYLFSKRFLRTIQETANRSHPFFAEEFLYREDSESVRTISTDRVIGVGIYQRSYYFMDRFMYQLQDKPHLELPFWVREFSEPFEDTEEMVEWIDEKR